MKIRNGFVSNSSSSSFLIKNTSNEDKTLVDFVDENPHLLDAYKEEYMKYSGRNDDDDISINDLLADAEELDITFAPDEELEIIFGDEDGTTLGRVYDYILRDGGSSDNFTWEFCESHR